MISVIMPVYNAAEFLADAIESILHQTIEDLELIIVNDGSTDRSQEIIHSYKDERIRYFEQPNGGESAARNTALRNVKGDFITFQDADDVSLPMRLETLLRHFYSDEIGMVHSDFLVIDEKNSPIGYLQTGNIEIKRLPRFFLKIGTPFNNPSMMFRSQLIQDFQYDTSLKIGPDTDMVFHAMRNVKSIHVSEPLVLYRRHSNNITNTKDYQTLFKHVQKYITEQDLENLIPEVDWGIGFSPDNEAKAKAILSLLISRRQMIADGEKWLKGSLQSIKNPETQQFIIALGYLGIGEYEACIEKLKTIQLRDHLIENYLGECESYLGNRDKALRYFLTAIMMKPDYQEAIDNLKGLGGQLNYHIVDNSWAKFRT